MWRAWAHSTFHATAHTTMDADALSATEVPDTQSTVSEREHEQTPHDDVTEPEELAQFKWREGACVSPFLRPGIVC